MAGDSQYFQAQNTKAELLSKQLDSNQTNEKLIAMKKIVAMISKGKDVEKLYPYVVKNVVCKHLEVKKLVYMYLIHYAEKCQDEALLSINNFQKDLSDKNQFIRALALRVMSSIKVGLITQIIVNAIKKCASDLSPYVRKSACLAIPKAYALDPELKQELSEVIEKALGDNNTMVLGAAMFAFNEVCPNNWEIIHPHYRKLCKYLVDCEEWGQIAMISVLTRYCRTQFLSPFKEAAFQKQQFYSDDEESDDPLEQQGVSSDYDLAPDHRLILTSAQPLLRTNNSAVVLSVASLYFHVAPQLECVKVVKPLLRLTRGPKETQFIVLSNIATMAKERPTMFTDSLKEFYVFSTDPHFIRVLKLEILSLLATETTVHQILKEFRSYLKFSEVEFVSATVRALGRVASEISEITETCIFDLMALVTSSPEAVVAESVIVIRHLIQKNPDEYHKVLKQMCLLLEDISVPVARASIIWMVGEYYDLISDIGPDALRIIAKNFSEESDIVKLQALTLGTKLFLKEGNAVNLLFQYILNLARFDLSYDIRDRARLIRTVLFNPKDSCGTLTDRASEIFLAKKPLSQVTSTFHERSRFAIGSLSHLVNHTAFGYEPLPDFPEKASDSTIRDSYDDIGEAQMVHVDKINSEDLFSGNLDFYSDEDEEEEEEEEDEEGSDLYGSENGDDFYSDSEEEEGDSEEEEDSGEEVSGEEDSEEEEEDSEDEDESGEEESGEEEESEEDESEEEEVSPPKKSAQPQKGKNQLIDFFD